MLLSGLAKEYPENVALKIKRAAVRLLAGQGITLAGTFSVATFSMPRNSTNGCKVKLAGFRPPEKHNVLFKNIYGFLVFEIARIQKDKVR